MVKNEKNHIFDLRPTGTMLGCSALLVYVLGREAHLLTHMGAMQRNHSPADDGVFVVVVFEALR